MFQVFGPLSGLLQEEVPERDGLDRLRFGGAEGTTCPGREPTGLQLPEAKPRLSQAFHGRAHLAILPY